MRLSVGKFALALGLLLALAGGSAQAATLQSIGAGFDEPIYLTSDPGNPDRLFVVERKGRIVEVADGARSVFADLRSVVGCGEDCGGERGLLSIALSPDFDVSGRLFVDYAEDPEPGDIHVAELRAGSLRDILTIPHPGESNHNGGQLQFGPEGNLFVSTGDGGGEDDQHHNAQNLGSLLGKILRIGPDPSGVLPYTVPAGNPVAGPAPYDTIWAYGLRNPFRFSFDRGGSGLWIGDVGEQAREEVDFGPSPGLGAGFNFGWNCREGRIEGAKADDEGCAGAPADAFVGPVFDYPHSDPGDGGASGCAVIGGYVSRDPGVADLFGRYVYGDLCVNKIRSFAPAQPFATDRSEGLQIANLNSFGEDSCGRLYAISRNGAIYRIAGLQPTVCPTAAGPSLASSFVGIRALRRRVKRNRHALLTAWVAPCKGRPGDPVTLWRGNKKLGVRRLDRVCAARFRPRISRRSNFRVTVKADETYAAAISRKLTIKPKKRHRRR